MAVQFHLFLLAQLHASSHLFGPLTVQELANDPRNVTFALHTLKDPFDDVLLRGGWNG